MLIEFIKLGELFFCLVEGRPHGRRVPSVGNHYPSLFVLFASFFVKYDWWESLLPSDDGHGTASRVRVFFYLGVEGLLWLSAVYLKVIDAANGAVCA